MTVSINGSGAITFNDASTQSTAATGFGFKNRIINGAMVIDQRNAGASVTGAVGNVYPVDRFYCYSDVASKFTTQQKSTYSGASNYESGSAPAGLVNSLKITSSSAYTVGASEVFLLNQPIEGLNVADLAWGTASASTVTLSFWVRSSLTGTFGGALRNSAHNRSYPFTYTISAANTFEYKTITIAGDQSGTWLTTNGIGIEVGFNIGVGSTYLGTAGSWAGANYISATGATNIIGTSGATFYITGVQLEKGSTATSFDYRPYGTELALCSRYFQYDVAGGNSYVNSSTYISWMMTFKTEMRTTPTVTRVSDYYINGTGTPYAETLSQYGFGATALTTGAGVGSFRTLFKADAEL